MLRPLILFARGTSMSQSQFSTCECDLFDPRCNGVVVGMAEKEDPAAAAAEDPFITESLLLAISPKKLLPFVGFATDSSVMRLRISESDNLTRNRNFSHSYNSLNG
jgi:hypothetical protein